MTGPVDAAAAAAALRVLYEPANWDWFTSGAAPAGGDDQGQARTQVLQNLGHHFSPETRDTFYRALQHSALLKQDWLARITQLSEPQDDLYSTSYDTTSFAPKALILFASTPAAVTPDAQLRIRDIADTYTQIATNTMAVGAGTMDLAEAARRNRDARERLLAELRSAPYSVLPEQNREPMRQLLDGDVLRARQSSVDAPEPSSLARRNRAINDHGRHPDPLSLRDELRSRFGRGKATGPTPVAGLKAAGWMLSGPSPSAGCGISSTTVSRRIDAWTRPNRKRQRETCS